MHDLPAHPLFQQLTFSDARVLQQEPMTSSLSFGRAHDEMSNLLGVLWHPDAPWVPQPCTRYATRDFRRGYPMTWDLEVPMRTVSRPLFLRPGVRRAEAPPLGWAYRAVAGGPEQATLEREAELLRTVSTVQSLPHHPKVESSSHTQADAHEGKSRGSGSATAPVSHPARPKETTGGAGTAAESRDEKSALKGSRMKGWSRSSAWATEDPWKDSR